MAVCHIYIHRHRVPGTPGPIGTLMAKLRKKHGPKNGKNDVESAAQPGNQWPRPVGGGYERGSVSTFANC